MAVFFLYSGAGFAHERRQVAGKYSFVVGFLNEPAFSGTMNGIDLKVLWAGDPVEGLEKSLKARVSFSGQKDFLPLIFRPRYNQPGNYAAYFLPALPGQYRFHIEGTIDGAAVDEVFQSGPLTFHDVEDSAPLQFPPLKKA